jgi:hypothetical protein
LLELDTDGNIAKKHARKMGRVIDWYNISYSIFHAVVERAGLECNCTSFGKISNAVMVSK